MSTAKKPKSPTLVTTDKVRLSYCHVWEPSVMKDQAGNPKGDPKYSVSIIIPKGSPMVDRIKTAIDAAIAESLSTKFGGKIPAVNFKTPLRDGDVERSDHPEYKNSYFINCSSKNKPGIIDKDMNSILNTTEVYSGCYARVNLNFYGFNNSGNKGIAAGLNMIQKISEGEALGGRVSAEEAFDPYEEDDLAN